MGGGARSAEGGVLIPREAGSGRAGGGGSARLYQKNFGTIRTARL